MSENTNDKPLTVRERIALNILLIMLSMVRAFQYEHKFDEQVRKIRELI